MSASPGSTSADEQRRRLTELQAAVRNLEADNKRLREGLSTSSRPVTGSALTSNGALFFVIFLFRSARTGVLWESASVPAQVLLYTWGPLRLKELDTRHSIDVPDAIDDRLVSFPIKSCS